MERTLINKISTDLCNINYGNSYNTICHENDNDDDDDDDDNIQYFYSVLNYF